MDSILRDKEQKLERLAVDEQIADKKSKIAERRKLEKGFKKGEGRDWKKILGVARGLKPDQEVIQTLYAAGGDLKEYSEPGKLRRL